MMKRYSTPGRTFSILFSVYSLSVVMVTGQRLIPSLDSPFSVPHSYQTSKVSCSLSVAPPCKTDIAIAPINGVMVCANGCPIIKENEQLPADDIMISYIMELKFIDKPTAVQILKNRIVSLKAQADLFSIAPVLNVPAVLITGKARLIRKLIEFKKVFEQPPV